MPNQYDRHRSTTTELRLLASHPPTFMSSYIFNPFTTSTSASSCGVVTTTAPSNERACVAVIWMSPVPVGRYNIYNQNRMFFFSFGGFYPPRSRNQPNPHTCVYQGATHSLGG